KCPDSRFTPKTGKTCDLNKHMDLTRFRLRQALLQLTQAQNASYAENAIPEQNQAKEPAVDLLTSDIPDIEDSEPNDLEYDTANENPDVYFKKIKDPYINRILKAEKFNEGEVCDYYAFMPKGYYAENEPLSFFESIEEKIANVYKRELKSGLKHETIEIIREDQINATIEKEYNEIIDQIEDEAIQESGYAFRPLHGSSYLPLPKALNKPQLGLINPQNSNNN
ncbi:22352_t:CDS:2, partial [Gigaspora rosea]